MKTLYKFNWDCGRSGEIDGLFVADKSEVENAIGKEIYFGEVLGKHSDIYGDLESKDFQEITQDARVIEKLMEAMEGNPTIVGYNPLEYLEDEEDEG